jgi:hypothetical protein
LIINSKRKEKKKEKMERNTFEVSSKSLAAQSPSLMIGEQFNNQGQKETRKEEKKKRKRPKKEKKEKKQIKSHS